VRTAFNILKVPHSIKPINLLRGEQQSLEYKQINPLGTVPAVQDTDGTVVWQSLAIIDYFDTHKQLLPTDRKDRARCIQIAQTIASDIQPVQNLSVLNRVQQLGGVSARTEWAIERNKSHLQIINDSLVVPGTQYCIGEKVTLADIFLIPQLYSAERFGIDLKTEFPNLYLIAKKLENLDEFVKAHPHNQSDCPEPVRRLGLFFA
jgi:maleylacetoacetate isomerase